MEKIIGIYKITSPTKKVYIGQSTDIYKRWKSYEKLACKNQTKIHRSFLKHGVENHKFEVICKCLIEELNKMERYYQDVYCAIGKYGLNCSLTKTDDRSGELSFETKAKIGLAGKGRKQLTEHIAKRVAANTGKKRTEETRLKMSIANKNPSNELRAKRSEAARNISDDIRQKRIESAKKIPSHIREKMGIANRKKIINKETFEVFIGVKVAAESIGMKYSTLAAMLNGQRTNRTKFYIDK